MSKRLSQVNELLKRELAQLLSREIELPRNILITVTQVEATKDLGQARVWISIFPFDQAERVLKILKRKRGFLQYLLNKKLVMKFIPEISFLLDKTEEEAGEIEKLLDHTD